MFKKIIEFKEGENGRKIVNKTFDSTGMLLDANKPCDRPNNSMCERAKKKNKKDKKGKKKSGKKSKKGDDKKKKGGKGGKKKTPKDKSKKKSAATVDSCNSWITLVEPESVKQMPTIFNPYLLNAKKKGGKKGKGSFKKFPFTGCGKDKKKKVPRVEEENNGPPCPKEINKKRVIDCPGDSCKEAAPLSHSIIRMLAKKKKDDKPEKCPEVSHEMCKDEDEIKDFCGTKRRGITKKCPADLLEKRRRTPKKPKVKKYIRGDMPSLAFIDVQSPSTSQNNAKFPRRKV